MAGMWGARLRQRKEGCQIAALPRRELSSRRVWERGRCGACAPPPESAWSLSLIAADRTKVWGTRRPRTEQPCGFASRGRRQNSGAARGARQGKEGCLIAAHPRRELSSRERKWERGRCVRALLRNRLSPCRRARRPRCAASRSGAGRGDRDIYLIRIVARSGERPMRCSIFTANRVCPFASLDLMSYSTVVQ